MQSVAESVLTVRIHLAPPSSFEVSGFFEFDRMLRPEGKELGLRCELGCHCVSRTLWNWRRKAVHKMGRNRRYEYTLLRMARTSPFETLDACEEARGKLLTAARPGAPENAAQCVASDDPHVSREISAPQIWVLSELGQPRRGDDPPLKGE